MRVFLIALSLFITLNVTAQKLKNKHIVGDWKVEKVLSTYEITDNYFLEKFQLMETIFSGAIFHFHKNGNFDMELFIDPNALDKERAEKVEQDLQEMKNTRWVLDDEKKSIKVLKKPHDYNLFRMDYVVEDKVTYFVMSSADMKLKVQKSQKK